MITPTQADRETAAQIAEWQRGTGWQPYFFVPSFADRVRAGDWDDHAMVQLIAQHALDATLNPTSSKNSMSGGTHV